MSLDDIMFMPCDGSMFMPFDVVTFGVCYNFQANAQADLSPCFAHSHFVGFVMLRLKCFHIMTACLGNQM